MSPSGGLEFVHSLARSGRPEDRAVWIRIAADYFARADGDDGGWVAHLRACLSDATRAERTVYAARLMASRSRAPGLWETLAELGGECARSAWKYSPALPRMAGREGLDLDTARAVATRADLDDSWIGAILDADDIEASTALASNPQAKLTSERLAVMAERARAAAETANDRRLSNALLSREPVRLELAPLFLEASPPVRQSLLLAAQRAELARRRPGATATLSRETIARLEQCALDGESEDFTLLLARSIGASPELGNRIVADPQGEPLAVALAAIGAPNDVCVRILTATDMRTGAAYRRLNALARLSDLLTPHAARRIIGALVEAGGSHAGEIAHPTLARANPRPALGVVARTDTAPASERPRLQPRKVNTFGAK